MEERDEGKEDEGLCDAQHNQRGNNQPQAPCMSAGARHRSNEVGSEGGEGAEGQHGAGPEACAGDDDPPFPQAVGELGGEEGKYDVHTHLGEGGKERRGEGQ
eukprot:evm.model.NODE_22544_length_5745_cov_57.576153.1